MKLLLALVVGLLSAASPSPLGAHDAGANRFGPERFARKRIVDHRAERTHRHRGSGVAGATSDVATGTLRVYQQGMYSPGLVVALQSAVTPLLKASGLGLVLIDCRRRPECEVPVRHELILRVAPGRHPIKPLVCGESLPGAAGRPGVLMTAFRACVTETTNAMRTRAFLGSASSVLRFLTEADVLARIVVHELIHLLLPGEVHGRGLSKGVLDEGDWEHAAHRGLRLEPATATRLRRALAARGGGGTLGQ